MKTLLIRAVRPFIPGVGLIAVIAVLLSITSARSTAQNNPQAQTAPAIVQAPAPQAYQAPEPAPVDERGRIIVCQNCGAQIGAPQVVYVAPILQPGANQVGGQIVYVSSYGRNFGQGRNVVDPYARPRVAWPQSVFPLSTDYALPAFPRQCR